MSLKKILSLINGNPHFKRFPSFVLIILMTMGTHHDIIFYLMGYVKLTYRQRKGLILARLQLQVYFMLTKRDKNSPRICPWFKLILRDKKHLDKFLIGSYQFHPFNVRVCNQMIGACESIRSYLWSKQYMNLFQCDGIFMPSLTEISSIMTQVSNERLFRFFAMNDVERHLLKSAIIILEMVTLLKKNETVFSFLTDPRNKRAPAKFFRIWKEIVYAGDSSGNPDSLGNGPDYQHIRLWQDVIFIWVLFLSLDPNFEMTLREYIDSDVRSYSPYSMATSTSEKMRDIFFSLSTDVKTFDFEGLMNGTQYDFLDFLRFIYDRRYRRDYYLWLERGRLFHYVLTTKNPRTFLKVNDKSLESENILERSQMCLNLFLENLPPDLEQFFQKDCSRFGM